MTRLTFTAICVLSLVAPEFVSAATHTSDTLDEVRQRINRGEAVLIDVREQSEWDAGHLRDAELVPLSELSKQPLTTDISSRLPRDRIIYCHCRSGGRVLRAADVLSRQGYDIRPLRSGFSDLLNAGFDQAKQAGPWIELFDGNTLAGWQSYDESRPIDHWEARDGVLSLARPGNGDLITDTQYSDFELDLNWKIALGANSGILYRVRRGDAKPWHGAIEYQIIDNAKLQGPENTDTTLHSTAAVYGLIAPSDVRIKPPGEWNSTKIVADGGRIQHWLNDRKVASADTSSTSWAQRVADSKFAKFDFFAKSGQGHICLQDHGGLVQFRAIRIRRLLAVPEDH